MSGSFWGGAAQGLMSAMKYMQDEERLDMARRREDRDEQEFRDKQELKGKLRQIGTDQAAELAGNANAEVMRGDLNSSANALAADAGSTKTFDGSAGAQAFADAENAFMDERYGPQPESVKKAVRSGYGLNHRSTPTVSFDFALRRAAAFDEAGDFKSAESIRKSASEDAAGHVLTALMNNDAATLGELSQLAPNGRNYRDVAFDPEGNVIFKRNGQTIKVPRIQAMAGALASVSPEKAATLLATAIQKEDYNKLRDWISTRDNDTRQEIAMLRMLMGGGGRGSSGAAGTGRGGGAQPDNSFSLKDFQKHVMGATEGDPAATELSFTAYKNYVGMVNANGVEPDDKQGHLAVANAAREIAAGKMPIVAEINPRTMRWERAGMDASGNRYWLDGYGVNPLKTPGTELAKMEEKDPGSAAKFVAQKEAEMVANMQRAQPKIYAAAAAMASDNQFTADELVQAMKTGEVRSDDGSVKRISPALAHLAAMIRGVEIRNASQNRTTGGAKASQKQGDSGTSNPLRFIPGLNLIPPGTSVDDLLKLHPDYLRKERTTER